MAQSVEGGNTRAKQRAGFHGVETLRHCSECFHGSDHVFLIAAIEGDSTNLCVLAIAKISAAAGDASAVLAAVPADADTLALFPAGDARTDVVNHAGDFVSWGAGILNPGPVSFFYQAVAVADAASLHANADVPGSWVGNLALDNFKIRSWFRHQCHFHFRH